MDFLALKNVPAATPI